MCAPLNQEVINDTAKLIMHRLIARSLARDASLIDKAKASLAEATVRFPHQAFIRDWKELLALPPYRVRALLTSRDQGMKRLRQSSPFVTAEGIDFTEQNLRRRIRRAAKRIAVRGRAGYGESVRSIAA
jgi:hypothetical protein